MIRHRNSTRLISGLTERVPQGTLALAGLYFLSSASMFFWAYMPRQMSTLGWTGAQIGLFFTVKTISQAVAMPAWVRLADRSKTHRPRLLKWQYVVAALAIAGLSVATSWTLGIIIAVLIGATLRCSPPLMDTMALKTVGLNRFGRVRAFGTMGFGVVALVFGVIGARLEHGLLAMSAPWAMLGLVVISVPLMSQLPGMKNRTDQQVESGSSTDDAEPTGPDVIALLKSPVVLLVFPVAALFAATYVPYELFLVNLAEERNFGAWLPGVAIFVGVVGEMLGFFSFRQVVKRISPEVIVAIVVAITGVRWMVTGTTTSPLVFVGLQILHGLTFAAFFMVMLELMNRQWGSELGATPQGLLYLLVFTAGNGLGTLVAGILYDIGSAASLFYHAGLVSLFVLPGLLLAMRFARKHASPSRFTTSRPSPSRHFVRRPTPEVGVQLEAAHHYARTTTSSSTSSRR